MMLRRTPSSRQWEVSAWRYSSQYPQDGVHFRGRTLPVGGGKREQRQRVNAQVRRAPDDAPCRFGPGAVAFRARQASRRGPAAVAIANDRHVHLDGRVGRHRGARDPADRVLHEHAAFSAANFYNVLCNTK